MTILRAQGLAISLALALALPATCAFAQNAQTRNITPGAAPINVGPPPPVYQPAPPPGYYPVEPAPNPIGGSIGGIIQNSAQWQAHQNWCYHYYRSYHGPSNTFRPYHGPRKPCRSPYWR